MGDISSGFREWLMARSSCCGERWWSKSIFGLESADFWMCMESSSKSKYVLTKQNQFKEAVKAGILKKFLNGKIVGGSEPRRVENCFSCSTLRITE